jgi:ABC-type sugar transport system permease subunit
VTASSEIEADAILGRPRAAGMRRARLSEDEHRQLRRRARVRRELTAWAFVGPQYAFFLAFLVLPVLGVFFWSVQRGGMIGGSRFVGLDNYSGLPNEVGASTAITNTFMFAVMSIPPTLVLALVAGILLARVKRGASVYRFLIYFPVLVPGIVAGLIWVFLTSVDFGLFNTVLRMFGLPPQTWLGQALALPVLAALDVWRNVGYWTIFFLAAVVGLPPELYQAARLDGASMWQRFRHLTVPLLRRIILFAVVVATIYGLQIFDTPYILTRGGPGTATMTIVFQVQAYVFGNSQGMVGLAAAISVVLFLAILVLTGIQVLLLRERSGGH